MNEIVICLIITAAIVYGYDYLSFPRTFAARIMSLIRGKEVTPDRIQLPKLLECSLCMSNWMTLIILLIMNWKLCWMCLVFSYLTKPILYIYNIIDLIVDKTYKVIYKLVDR